MLGGWSIGPCGVAGHSATVWVATHALLGLCEHAVATVGRWLLIRATGRGVEADIDRNKEVSVVVLSLRQLVSLRAAVRVDDRLGMLQGAVRLFAGPMELAIARLLRALCLLEA